MKYSFSLSVQIVRGYSVAVHCVGSSVDGHVDFGNFRIDVFLAIYRVGVFEENDHGSHAFSRDVNGLDRRRFVFRSTDGSTVTNVYERKVRVHVLVRGLGVHFRRFDRFVNELRLF